MSQREVEALCEKMLSEYFDTLELEDCSERQFIEDYLIVTTMTESGKAAFLFEWAERLRAACSSTETLIRPPPLNGGGLFVRED